jgi:hypothetical protein
MENTEIRANVNTYRVAAVLVRMTGYPEVIGNDMRDRETRTSCSGNKVFLENSQYRESQAPNDFSSTRIVGFSEHVQLSTFLGSPLF